MRLSERGACLVADDDQVDSGHFPDLQWDDLDARILAHYTRIPPCTTSECGTITLNKVGASPLSSKRASPSRRMPLLCAGSAPIRAATVLSTAVL